MENMVKKMDKRLREAIEQYELMDITITTPFATGTVNVANVMTFFEEKLITSIESDKAIVVSICSQEVKYLDSVKITDFNIESNDVYLMGDDLELHIEISEDTSVKYYDEIDEYFSFVTNEAEINLYFS